MMLGMRYGLISCMTHGQKSISATLLIHLPDNLAIIWHYHQCLDNSRLKDATNMQEEHQPLLFFGTGKRLLTDYLFSKTSEICVVTSLFTKQASIGAERRFTTY